MSSYFDCSRCDFDALLGVSVESSSMCSAADLNSFNVDPIARPNCGNFVGPK